MAQRILYFLVPGTNISPFDVTIAADAGFDQVIPLTGVKVDEVPGLVQDAIFCRPPKRFNDTGIFIGGRDVHIATDMFQAARKAMVGDFRVGLFADPNGAYTTSASVVALVENALHRRTGTGLAGRRVAVFGPGPVGLCTAVLAARQQARVTLCRLTANNHERAIRRFCERYEVNVELASAETSRAKREILEGLEVALCTARAGVRILDRELLDQASQLLVAADVNAVPPSGIEGIEANDNQAMQHTTGATITTLGALTIGGLKYKTQFSLYRAIQVQSEPALLDFPQAFACALEELRKTTLTARAA